MAVNLKTLNGYGFDAALLNGKSPEEYTPPKWELLWTNADVSSAFATQTISVDLTAYDAFQIIYMAHTGFGAKMSTGIIPLSAAGSGKLLMIGQYSLQYEAESTDVDFAFRHYAITTNGAVKFYGGYSNDLKGSDGGTANDKFCVPYMIYGIKGV